MTIVVLGIGQIHHIAEYALEQGTQRWCQSAVDG